MFYIFLYLLISTTSDPIYPLITNKLKDFFYFVFLIVLVSFDDLRVFGGLLLLTFVFLSKDV